MRHTRETRFVPAGEVRADDAEGNGIEGFSAVTGSLSRDLGGFVEEIEPGAFVDAVERSDIVALFNHDANMVLGRSTAGTLEVDEREGGLYYRVPNMPASRADVLEAIRRGDVTGNSFSFVVETDRWETRDGRDVRVIEKVAELFDVGPVVYPAYPATTVSARAVEVLAERRSARGEGAPAGDTTADPRSNADTVELDDAKANEIATRHAHRRRRLDLADADG